ncbi:MAG TPA: FxsA family protein [Hyphomicrobiales bacterium]|nr:FxsA family protein [Hyphomicrobiales bacterium]
MPFIVFFILISLPVLEVASIVEVSRWIGPLGTFLLLAASVAFGAFLLRAQGLAVARRVAEALEAGAPPPEKPLLDSAMLALAGILFMIPGFITDIFAILIILPATRRWMWRGVSFGLRRPGWRRIHIRRRPDSRAQDPSDAIDVEFREVPQDQPRNGTGVRRDDSPWRKSV